MSILPSFVIVTSPTSSTNILSRPYGPKELFTIFAIANTAVTKSLVKGGYKLDF